MLAPKHVQVSQGPSQLRLELMQGWDESGRSYEVGAPESKQ